MENLPVYINIVFGLITFVTVWLFYKAVPNAKGILAGIVVWLLLQAVVSLRGFYTFTGTTPPRFTLLIAPPLLLIVMLFATAKGRRFLDTLQLKTLTLIHIVRIPVELVLFWLFLHKGVPQLMTFEGRNFDVLSGLSAPVVYYFGFSKNKINRKLLLLWNVICLGLLINIVINAVLSAPFSFQKFGFEQPNVALLYFPFVWLPCCIVPLVLLSHLAAIRQLLMNSTKAAPGTLGAVA